MGNATGFIGVQKLKAGKFGASIRDPIKRKSIWLGSFDTAEEASKAYFMKKQEFLATLQSVDKPSKGLLGTKRLKSGRYGAVIKDPITHKEVWLGTFDTVEVASEAYFSKKSEFKKLVKINQGIEPSSEEESCLMVNIHGKKSSDRCIYTVTSYPKAKRSLLGIQRRKNGWNAAVIRDLVRCKKARLGTSDTKNCDQIEPESPVEASLSVDDDQTLNVASVVSKRTIDSHEPTHVVGVCKGKSGRYTSKIKDPISKKTLYLGTFDTAEEASQAFQSKKLQLKKLVEAKQQCNRKTHSSATAKQDEKEKLVNAKQGHETVNREGYQLASDCGASSLETDVAMSNSSNGGSEQRIESYEISRSEILLGTLGTVEEAFSAHQCKKSVFQRTKMAELQSDMPTDSSAGKAQEGQEDEDLWKGQWVQLPGNKEVNFSLKLGVPIIDNYGCLLGDFSTLDDLSFVEHSEWQ